MNSEQEKENLSYIDPKILAAKLSSKKDWYDYLKFSRKFLMIKVLEGFLLPSYKRTSMRFIRDILRG